MFSFSNQVPLHRPVSDSCIRQNPIEQKDHFSDSHKEMVQGYNEKEFGERIENIR